MRSKAWRFFLTLLMVLAMFIPAQPVQAEETASPQQTPVPTASASPEATTTPQASEEPVQPTASPTVTPQASAEPTETPVTTPQATAEPTATPKAPVIRKIISPVDKYARRRYEFYTDNTFGTLLSSQTVKNGETLHEPDHPDKAGNQFQYWQTEKGQKLSFNEKHELNVSDIDESKKSVETVRVYPVYEQKYTVTFHDMDGSVITIREASEGQNISTTDIRFEVVNGYYVSGWTTSPDGSESGIVGNTVKANASSGFTDGNLNLYPIVKDVCWVIFDDGLNTSSTERAYTAPVRVRQNTPVTRPANPTRNGYEFVGWSTKKNGTENDLYDFSKPVTASMVLYAVWKPVDHGTSFTVQVMAEKLVNGKHVDGSYEPVGQYIPTATPDNDESQTTRKIKATAEQVVNPTNGQTNGITLDQNDITTWLDTKSGLQNSYAYDFEKMDQNVTVNGDGTTIVYVYYKLHVFTVKFTIVNHSIFPEHDGGIEYSDPSKGTYAYYKNYVDSVADVSYQFKGHTYHMSDDGDDTCYQFHARLGEDISDVYPGPNDINATISIKDGVPEDDDIKTLKQLRPYAWYQTEDNKDHQSYNRPGHYSVMSTNLINADYTRENPKDYTLYYKWQLGGIHKITHVMVEDVDDDRFSEDHVSESNTAASYIVPSPLRGYTWVYGTEDEEQTNAPEGYPKTDTTGETKLFYFYYYRNRYSLDFWNNGTRVKAYDSDDKTSPSSRIKHGTALSGYYFVPERPSNLDDSYQFEGWYTTSDFEDGTKVDFSTEKMPIGNLTLYAHWTVPDVHVTYDLNGGHSSQVSSVNVKYGNVTEKPADPKRDGYSFVTWVDKETTQPYNFTTKLFADKTLVARWIDGRKIRLVYDAGEGGKAPVDKERYLDVSRARVLSAPEAPKGKYFYGWEYNGQVYQPGRIIDVLSEYAEKESKDSYKITLTAVYGDEPARPVVIYDMNDGSGKQYQTEPYDNNSTVNVLRLSDVNFSREGYTFTGWNTKADGSGDTYQPGDEILIDNNGSNLLYAQWKKSAVPQNEKNPVTPDDEKKPAVSENVKKPVSHEDVKKSSKKPEKKASASVKKSSQKPADKAPDTSDHFHATVWAGMFGIAAVVIAGILMYRKKYTAENKE